MFHLKAWLRKNPANPKEGVTNTLLRRGAHQSQHLVQIKDHEKPHVHKKHDLTVFFLKGKGTLLLGAQRFPITKGDVVFIPKGAAHHYIHKGRGRTVCCAVFSPPFDGKDTLPID